MWDRRRSTTCDRWARFISVHCIMSDFHSQLCIALCFVIFTLLLLIVIDDCEWMRENYIFAYKCSSGFCRKINWLHINNTQTHWHVDFMFVKITIKLLSFSIPFGLFSTSICLSDCLACEILYKMGDYKESVLILRLNALVCVFVAAHLLTSIFISA